MLDFCRRYAFNRLLIQIPWMPGTAQSMATLTADNPGPGSIQPQMLFKPQLAHLIAAAAADGIAAEALDGNPFMGRKQHWAETLASEQAIIDFNATLPAKARFAGIHWDIEPYTRADWKTSQRPQIMSEYLDLLSQAKQKLASEAPGLTLAVDIPFWYPHATTPDNSCVLEFNGVTKNFHQHIQDIVDYVGIMSYRRSADGPNGAIGLCDSELTYAEKIDKFVCPALETVKLDDTPQITFYGQPAEKFLAVQKAVWDKLQDRPGFGGMLIHFYPGVRAVLEPGTADRAAGN